MGLGVHGERLTSAVKVLKWQILRKSLVWGPAAELTALDLMSVTLTNWTELVERRTFQYHYLHRDWQDKEMSDLAEYSSYPGAGSRSNQVGHNNKHESDLAFFALGLENCCKWSTFGAREMAMEKQGALPVLSQ